MKMYKVILDPNLFECDENTDNKFQLIHYKYLDDCISFLSEYCEVKLDLYESAPYYCRYSPYTNPPITKSHYMKTHYNEIRRKIQKIQDKNFSFVVLDSIVPNIEIKGMNFITRSECKDVFFKYINSQLEDTSECIIILGMNNKAKNICIVDVNKKQYNIQAIHKIFSDCSQRVVNILSVPNNIDDIFPCKLACQKLNDSFLNDPQNEGLDMKGRISIMKIYGIEVASRNFYLKDEVLSRKNPQYIVFLHRNGKYAISIDQEHGGLEIFKKMNKSRKYKNGKTSSFEHLGEYTFSGEPGTRGAQPYNHILYD